MPTFVATLIAAFIILSIALLCMAVGYFVRRSDVLTKRCGMKPGDEKDDKCGTKKECSLCGRKDKDEHTD